MGNKNIHSRTRKRKGRFGRHEASPAGIQHCGLKACEGLREPERHHVLSAAFLHLPHPPEGRGTGPVGPPSGNTDSIPPRGPVTPAPSPTRHPPLAKGSSLSLKKRRFSYIRTHIPIFTRFQATLFHPRAAAAAFKLVLPAPRPFPPPSPDEGGPFLPRSPQEASPQPHLSAAPPLPAVRSHRLGPRRLPGQPPLGARPRPPSPPPSGAPPELQLVQVLEQAAGAVRHGGGAVEAASELPA